MNELATWVTGVIALFLPGFGVAPEPVYNGYVEANFIYIGPVTPGIISQIHAREGDSVKAGDLLFVQTTDQQRAAIKAAEAQLAVAIANLENQSTGSRPEELAVIRANLSEAEASRALAETSLDRTSDLQDRGFSSQAQLDQAQNALASADAHVEQLRAQLSVARLPARDAALIAAEANVEAARSSLQSAEIAFADRTATAPADGRIDKIYYRAGEMAPAASPVVSILVPGEARIKFFIPEDQRLAFSVGSTMALDCDNCPQNLAAEVTRMAAEPQHTPPLIYSRDERARLVFAAEARPVEGFELPPGQPVTLTRSGK